MASHFSLIASDLIVNYSYLFYACHGAYKFQDYKRSKTIKQLQMPYNYICAFPSTHRTLFNVFLSRKTEFDMNGTHLSVSTANPRFVQYMQQGIEAPYAQGQAPFVRVNRGRPPPPYFEVFDWIVHWSTFSKAIFRKPIKSSNSNDAEANGMGLIMADPEVRSRHIFRLRLIPILSISTHLMLLEYTNKNKARLLLYVAQHQTHLNIMVCKFITHFYINKSK